MQMIEVKVSELTGPALDWAVAKSLGWHMIPVPRDCDGGNGGYEVLAPPSIKPGEWIFPPKGRIHPGYFIKRWSTDWSQGGPLIEKHRISIDSTGTLWAASKRGWLMAEYSPAPLIAACRAIVAAKLGDVVQVPAELMQEISNG